MDAIARQLLNGSRQDDCGATRVNLGAVTS